MAVGDGDGREFVQLWAECDGGCVLSHQLLYIKKRQIL